MTNQIINKKNIPNCFGPYSQVINIGNMIFVSGQIGICPETNKVFNDIKQQTSQILKNIKIITETSGSNIKNIIKTTIFMTNINDLNIINTIYQDFFNIHDARFPARSCIGVSNLPKNASIEIEAIAKKI